MAIMLGMLLFIPCLFTFGQVSITPDNTPPHPSSMLEVKSTERGMLIPRMTQAQRLDIENPAPGLMVYQFCCGDANGDGFYYFDGTVWERNGVHTGLYVGKPHAGGIIFWLDETGKHGLICSMVDLSTSHVWSNVDNVLIGPTAQSDWNGNGNSLAIVNQQNHTSSAAKLCLDYVNADYGTGVYSDWYLMTTGEARHLTNNIYQVQKALELDTNPATTPISNETYWTSNEVTADSARVCGFVADYDQNGILKSEPLFVRAVRAF